MGADMPSDSMAQQRAQANRLYAQHLYEQHKAAQTQPQGQIEPQQQESVPTWEAGLRGFAQGASFGFSEEIGAGLMAPFSKRTMSEILQDERKRNAISEEQHPYAYGGGQLVGGVVSPVNELLAPLGAAKGIIGAAAIGSAGTINADKPADMAKQFVEGTVSGAAVGGALHGVASKASSAAEWLQNKLKKSSAESAYNFLTKGKAPRTDKFGKEALGEKVLSDNDIGVKLSDTPESMMSRVKTKQSAVGKDLGTMRSDAQKMIDEGKIKGISVGQLSKDINEKVLSNIEDVQTKESVRKFVMKQILKLEKVPRKDSATERKVLDRAYESNKRMGIDQTYDQQRTATKKANFRRNNGNSIGEEAFKQVYGEYGNKLKETVGASLKKAGLEPSKYDDAMASYHMFSEIPKKIPAGQQSKGDGALKAAGGLIGSGSIGAAAYTGNPSLLTGVIVGHALDRYGHQASILMQRKGANMLSKITNAPEAFGRFAPFIQEAAKRGPKAVAALTAMFMEREPEYKNIIDSMESMDSKQD